MENKDITVIIPLHKYDEEINKLTLRALESIEPFHDKVKTMIVGPKEVLANFDGDFIELVENTGDLSVQGQINKGLEHTTTKWFSILEFDDFYSKFWYDTMVEYSDFYGDTVDVFLPIVKNVSTDEKVLGLSNETSWARGFTERNGFIDHETLLEYDNYQLIGALINREKALSCGPEFLKDNIKVTFMYETLLRLTHNQLNVLTVPKIGYTHTLFREGSLFWNSINDENEKLSNEESLFWLETSKTESKHNDKRLVTFEPNAEEA